MGECPVQFWCHSEAVADLTLGQVGQLTHLDCSWKRHWPLFDLFVASFWTSVASYWPFLWPLFERQWPLFGLILDFDPPGLKS